ncbi:MAG TPA: alkaline phosphatase D family protein [Hyphomonadaceae bacterium]|nr:alkaline phosphatase D family protein [Hyphomonadaceae bacterium]
MTRLTRRGALGLGVAGIGAAGLAACETTGEGGGASGKFNHGVASGDPTQTNVIIWTRVTPVSAGPISVKWNVSRDPQFKDVVKRGEFVTGPERDYTVKVDVDGLEAGKVYYYWFTSGSASSPGGITRTLPASGLTEFKMAVVSCSNWPFGFFNGYREIAKRREIDAVVHVGDYIYEYGVTGYGGEDGKKIGRNHEPANECVKLEDYRTRYAQYRSDPDLQAAHAACPWFVTWDDHESANNSYKTGAENHQPETEGSWDVRKAAAVKCYLEWMPIRDPDRSLPREAIFRKFDIGDLATLFMLETRLTARGPDTTIDEVGLAPDNQKQKVANEIMAKINDPNRVMMGSDQERWLADGLKASVAAGKKWQVLGNQVVLAKVKMPDLQKGLPPEKYAKVSEGSRRFWSSAKYGLPWNLDSWCGFPRSRERLYAAARAAKARMVALSGDSHTAWANELHDAQGYRVGVEFSCTAITSHGAGDSLPFEELNFLMPDANDEVVYYNAFAKGFTVLTLKADQVEAEFVKLSTVKSRDYFAATDARFLVRADDAGGIGGLQRPLGGAAITQG